MKASINIAKIFPKHLFWDVDPAELDVQLDRDLIIPRALFATTEKISENDIELLETLYKRTEIVQELQSTPERISNAVCTLVAKLYRPKHFFRL